MKPRIIVADDSLTIQKVIKITLANEDFDLIECLDESKLNTLIQENSPTLVLLDFNLSENKTGYDLTKEIRSAGVPKVFMLYGTFDTVDKKLLEHSGASSHIVKPFEGTKFINQCRQLIEDVDLEEDETFPDPISDSAHDIEQPDAIVDEEDQWVVNQPEVEEELEDEYVSEEIISVDEKNSLHKGMEDWGMDVPSVIGDKVESPEVTMEFPPIIEEQEEEKNPDNYVENDAPSKDDEVVETPIKEAIEIEVPETVAEPVLESVTEASSLNSDEETLPASEDLEYPDIDMIKSSVEAEDLKPKSKLISIAELAEENTDEEEYEQSEGTKTKEEVLELEAQIADELEEDIWSADEVHEDPTAPSSHVDETAPEEEVKAEEVEAETSNIDSNKTGEINLDISKLAETHLDESKVLEMLEPIVERLVEKRVNEVLEKVAWEVIPDLSENLIKKELERISETIINSKK